MDLTKKKRALVVTCGRQEMVAPHYTNNGRGERKGEVRRGVEERESEVGGLGWAHERHG